MKKTFFLKGFSGVKKYNFFLESESTLKKSVRSKLAELLPSEMRRFQPVYKVKIFEIAKKKGNSKFFWPSHSERTLLMSCRRLELNPCFKSKPRCF